jgi:hypothetical protein
MVTPTFAGFGASKKAGAVHVDCARKSVKGMHTDPGWQSIPRLLLES